MIDDIIRHTKRVIIFAIGSTVLAFGIMLVFTPGPAILFIPLGLFILATEFIWARKLLKRVKEKMGINQKTK